MDALPRRLAAEALGTAFLLAVVVGSGIMAERLFGGSTGLALLANALATGAGLFSLILVFGPVSGAHFNPAVTVSEALQRRLPWPAVTPYVLAQLGGALLGVAVAHLMFGLPLFSVSGHVRSGGAQGFSEFVATLGLLCVIASGVRHFPDKLPQAVAAYIVSAYWFTASTSFANPAVTLARSLSDSFAGIRPQDVPLFLLAQMAAAVTAPLLMRWLLNPRPAPVPSSFPDSETP